MVLAKKMARLIFIFRNRVSRGIKNPYAMFIMVRKQFPNVTTRNQCDNLEVFFFFTEDHHTDYVEVFLKIFVNVHFFNTGRKNILLCLVAFRMFFMEQIKKMKPENNRY